MNNKCLEFLNMLVSNNGVCHLLYDEAHICPFHMHHCVGDVSSTSNQHCYGSYAKKTAQEYLKLWLLDE